MYDVDSDDMETNMKYIMQFPNDTATQDLVAVLKRECGQITELTQPEKVEYVILILCRHSIPPFLILISIIGQTIII